MSHLSHRELLRAGLRRRADVLTRQVGLGLLLRGLLRDVLFVYGGPGQRSSVLLGHVHSDSCSGTV